MFRVYVEGKSVTDLKRNMLTMANSLFGDVAAPEIEDDTCSVEEDLIPESNIVTIPLTQKPTTQVHNPLENGSSHGTNNTLVDSRGIPWDERIHSGNKATNKDGSWRNRRGVDPELLAKIEAELPRRAASQPVRETNPTHQPQATIPAIPASFAQPVAPTVPFVPPPVPPSPVSAIPATPSIPVEPAHAQQPPQQVAPQYESIPIPQGTKPAHSLETFRRNFVQTIHLLVSTKQIDQNYLERLKNYFKVGELWDIAKDDQKSAEMFESFVQGGLITKVG